MIDNPYKFSDEALKVFKHFGSGMRLCMGANRFFCMAPPTYSCGIPSYAVSEAAGLELIKSPHVRRMEEFTANYILGWRDCGFPGDVYYIYSAVQ